MSWLNSFSPSSSRSREQTEAFEEMTDSVLGEATKVRIRLDRMHFETGDSGFIIRFHWPTPLFWAGGIAFMLPF
jgi:hypothetical protein